MTLNEYCEKLLKRVQRFKEEFTEEFSEGEELNEEDWDEQFAMFE